MESILTSIKKLLNVAEDDTSFDTDIIIHINTYLMVLTQLGVGPEEGFMIEDDSSTWEDFVPDVVTAGAAKTYIYIRVKLVFDPPTSSAVITAMEQNAKELEWRLNVNHDSAPKS